MFLFYRLTGRRGKRWETEREGEVTQLQSPAGNSIIKKKKQKPSKGPDIEKGEKF